MDAIRASGGTSGEAAELLLKSTEGDRAVDLLDFLWSFWSMGGWMAFALFGEISHESLGLLALGEVDVVGDDSGGFERSGGEEM